MQLHQGVDPPRRRRWRREPVAFTVLGRFSGRDRLGKAVNLSERGLGVVFQGHGYAVDQTVELNLVAGAAVRRVFGVVRSAVPAGRRTRVGIRTFGCIPTDAGDGWTWAAGRRRPALQPQPCAARLSPAPWNLGANFPLISPGGVRAMERDRKELARDLRALYAVGPDEPWDLVLRRFLDQLSDSPLRHRFVREQFRAAMDTLYPAADGTVICGTLIPADTGDSPGGEMPPCIIHLDYFAVACSDRQARFLAKGIPTMDDTVTVPLRVANHAVLSTTPVVVQLPRLTTVEIQVDVPIVLRSAPTADEADPAAPPEPEQDTDLDDFRHLVDQL